MAERTEAGLARARRFGIEVGLASIALGALLAWRGTHPWLRVALAVVGVALLALALARPSLLVRPAAAWLAFGDRLARVTTPILLGAIYLLVITPAGFLRRTVWRSPIRRDRAAASYWVRRPDTTPEARRSAMEHQF